jgi:hypothetical protein
MTICSNNTLAPMESNEKDSGGGERPLIHGCLDCWTWSKRDRSPEVWLSGTNVRTVHFHPNWSKGMQNDGNISKINTQNKPYNL